MGGRGLLGRLAFDDALLEAIGAAVVVTDLEGMIVAANRRAEEFYGRAREELIGHDSSVLRVGPMPEEIRDEIGEAILAGRSWEGEFTVRGSDGTNLGIHLLDTPAFDEAGRLVGVVGLAVDVTENRHGRDDLARALAGSHLFRELVDTLAADTSVGPVARLMLDTACRVTGATVGSYLTVVAERAGCVAVTATAGEHGLSPGEIELGQHVLTGLFIRTEPLVVVDVSENSWSGSSLLGVGCATDDRTGTMMFMPVRSRTGAGVGIMALGHPEPGYFGDADVRALAAVAEHAGLALDLAGLLRAVETETADSRRAEKVQRFLAEASEAFTTVGGMPLLFERIARVAVPFLADSCAVDLIESDGRVRRVATVTAHPSAHVGNPFAGQGEGIIGLRAGFIAELSEDPGGALDGTSVMCVPLRARGRHLGVLTLTAADCRRRFGADDLSLAEDYARLAALAIDNARMYAERAHAASVLQSVLLPKVLPEVPGAEVAVRYLAAGARTEVGGDFYDVFLADDGSTWIVIGDVSGKGPEAAAVVGLARHTLRALGRRESLPRRLLADLHAALLLEDRGEYCTVCVGRLERDSDGGATLTVAAGGHPAPIVRRATGLIERARCSGTLVGMPITVSFTEQVIPLGPGDAVVFHTDGVSEERDATGEELGDARVALTVRNAGRGAVRIADRIVERVCEHGSGVPRDDVAVVVLEMREEL